MVKICQFTNIANHRVFSNWTSGDQGFEFRSLNVGYAENGSGKSSLASLLRPEESRGAWDEGVTLKLKGPSRTVSDPDDTVFDEIIVFNREYIKRSVSLENGGEISVLHLGEAAVRHAKRQTELKVSVESAFAAHRAAEYQEGAALSDHKRERAKVAREVKDCLSGNYKYRSYNAARLPDAKSISVTGIEDSNEMRERLSDEAVAKELPALRDPLVEYALPGIDWAGIGNLLSIESIPVDALDYSLKKWLELGLELHSKEDECKFCLGSLRRARVEDLAAMVEAAEQDFQGRLSRARESVCRAQEAVALLLRKDQLDPTSTYPSLRQRVPAANLEQVDLLQRAATGLDGVISAIDSKRSPSLQEHFTREDAIGELVGGHPGWYAVASPKMVEIARLHSGLSADLEGARERAAMELEKLILTTNREKLVVAQNALNSAAGVRKTSEENLHAARESLAMHAAKSLGAEHGPGAINERLHRILGRSDLSIGVEISSDQTERYIVRRRGDAVDSLSEGEHTALAVIHFLVSIGDLGRSPSSLCVVIDDPISSLDQNVSYGISALLWDELVGPICSVDGAGIAECTHKNKQVIPRVAQLILLTHDFTLFKNWSQKSDVIGKAWKGRDVLIFEMRTERNSLKAAAPQFIELKEPQIRRLLRSEYHYLFNRAAVPLIEGGPGAGGPDEQRDLSLLIPNALRRLVDAFLSHFDPGSLSGQSPKTFRSRVGSACAIAERDNANLMRLLPVSHIDVIVERLNELSHFEESGAMPWQPKPSIDFISRCCFEFMFVVDPGHVARTASALGVELDGLIRADLVRVWRSSLADKEVDSTREAMTLSTGSLVDNDMPGN